MTGEPARFELHRPVGRGEIVEFGARPIHRDQRGRFGEAVDLHELPAEFGFGPFDRARRRRRARHHDPHTIAARDRSSRGGGPLRGGVEHHVQHRWRPAHQRHAVGLDPAEDLHAVDLAQDHVGPAHARDGVQHAPSVAVELGERVQVRVTIAHAHVPPEDRGVEPQIAVGQVHAFGSNAWFLPLPRFFVQVGLAGVVSSQTET